ncbi:MAG: PIN domain-containing protein [Acidobacteriota bacterium]|nr:PIN domain-containing protein [Acidobacteriota bacterium]
MSAGDNLELVDTNVLVYQYDESAAEKKGRAFDLVDRLWSERTGALSIQVLQEFFVTVTRKVPRPVSATTARELLSSFSTWHVHRPETSDVLAAVDLQQRYQTSFWDAMILRSAQALGCRILWTEDLNSGQSYDGVIVRNPFADLR